MIVHETLLADIMFDLVASTADSSKREFADARGTAMKRLNRSSLCLAEH
jgi:hypothetical protein